MFLIVVLGLSKRRFAAFNKAPISGKPSKLKFATQFATTWRMGPHLVNGQLRKLQASHNNVITD